LSVLKSNGILHFYDFVHENEFESSKKKVILGCEKNNRKCTIINFAKCGQFGPGKYRVCVDARVE
jgi:tRNA G37 N-methylase Trm5